MNQPLELLRNWTAENPDDYVVIEITEGQYHVTTNYGTTETFSGVLFDVLMHRVLQAVTSSQ